MPIDGCENHPVASRMPRMPPETSPATANVVARRRAGPPMTACQMSPPSAPKAITPRMGTAGSAMNWLTRIAPHSLSSTATQKTGSE